MGSIADTVHEATGCTPQELFLQEAHQYNPMVESVQFSPRTPQDYHVKLTMAREIQLFKAEKRNSDTIVKGLLLNSMLVIASSSEHTV